MLTVAVVSRDVVSLPSRERGLKSFDERGARGLFESLPSRERGLKFFMTPEVHAAIESLPSRERGLK